MEVVTIKENKEYRVVFEQKYFTLYELKNYVHYFINSREGRGFYKNRAFMGDVVFIRYSPENGLFSFVENPEFLQEDYAVLFYDSDVAVIIPKNEFFRCDLSGDYVHISQLATVEIEGNIFRIRKCFDVQDLFCPTCGKLLLTAEHALIKTEDDSYFCSADCALAADFRECENCGKWVNDDDGEEIGINNSVEFICGDCLRCDYSRCDNCGEWVKDDDDDRITVGGNVFCCPDCAEQAGYYTCEDCGSFSDDLNDFQGRDLCPSCYYNQFSRAENLIHEYHYTPEYKFHRDKAEIPGQCLYFGTEVEFYFAGKENFVNGINLLDSFSENNDELIYLKHDSTTGENGVELVSMPCTLSWHHSEKGKNLFKDVYEIMEDNEAHKHSKCGMHVHMSRKSITEKQEINIEMFFQRFQTELELIAERKENDFCVYPYGRDLSDKEEFLAENNDGDRYRAVNWENDKTVEIRIFSSALTYETYIKNIEFCHCLYQFTKTQDIETVEKMGFGNFLLYAREHSEQYPHFVDFINRNF